MLPVPGRVSKRLRTNLCPRPNMAYGIAGWVATGSSALTHDTGHLRVTTGSVGHGASLVMPGLGGGYYVVQAKVWSGVAQNVSIGLEMWDNSEATLLNGFPYTQAVPLGNPTALPAGTVLWSVVWLPDWYGAADARLSITRSSTGSIWIDEVAVERVRIGDGQGEGFVGAVDRTNFKTNPGPNLNAYPSGYGLDPQVNVTLDNTGGGLIGTGFFPPTRVRATATGAVAAGQSIIGYGFAYLTAGTVLSGSVMAARTGTGTVRARLQILQGGSLVLGTATAYSTPTAGTGSLYTPPTIVVPTTGDYEIRLIVDTNATMAAANVLEGWRWLMTDGVNTYFDGSSVPSARDRVHSWGQFQGEVGDVSYSAPVTYPAYFDGDVTPSAPVTGYGPPWDGLVPESRWLGEPGFSESVLSTPVESYWLDDDTETTPSLRIGLAVEGEGSFADEEASRYPGSARISRDLTGGNLPGQVRGKSGFSKASGSMSVALPGVTPWRGPLLPGGTAYLSLDPGLTSPEATVAAGRTTPVFLGEHLVTSFGADTAQSVEKSLDIEQYAPGLNRPPVVPALIPDLPWIGEAGLDATHVLDVVLRSAGYYATPKATPTQAEGVYPLLSVPMQGSLLAEIGHIESHFAQGPPRFETVNQHVMWAPMQPDEAHYVPEPVTPDLRLEYSNEGSILLGVDLKPTHPNGAFVVELVGTVLQIAGEDALAYGDRLLNGITRVAISIQQGRLYVAVRNHGPAYAITSTDIGVTQGRIGIEIQAELGGGVRARATWGVDGGVNEWSAWTAEARSTTAGALLYTVDWEVENLWVGIQDMSISSLVYARRPEATADLQGELYLADFVRPDRLEDTATLSLADSPLLGVISVEGEDGWSILQDLATKTQGAMWLAEDGPVYRSRHLMRGATGVVDRVKAQESLADIPWRVTIDDMADRVEVTYGGVVSQVADSAMGQPRIKVWELTDKVMLAPRASVTFKAEWEGAAQNMSGFRSAYDTIFPGLPESASTYAMAYMESGGGTQPPDNSLIVTVVQTGPSSADVSVKSNSTKTLWLVNGFGDPTLVLRVNLLLTEADPRTMAAGVDADQATNPLHLDLRPWVQDDQAAADILGWVKAQTERPLPVLEQVSIRPNALRQIGDVVSLIDDVDTGLDSKVLVSSLTTQVAPGSFKQDANITLLDPTFYDLDAAFSDEYEANSVALVNVFQSGEWIDDVGCVTTFSSLLVSAPGDGWLHAQVNATSAFASRLYLAPANEDNSWYWTAFNPPVTGRVPVSVRAKIRNTSGVTLYARAALRFEDHDAPGLMPPTTDTAWVAIPAGAVVDLAQSWTMDYFRSLSQAVPVLLVSTSNATPDGAEVTGNTYQVRRVAVFLGHGLNPVPYYSGDTPDGGTEIYSWDGVENNSSSTATSTETGLALRQNLVPDPRATNSAVWSWSAGTGGVVNRVMVTDADDGPVLPDGTQVRTYQRATWTTGNTATPINAGYTVTGQGIPVTAGDVVSAAIYFRLSQTATSARISFRPWNGANMADVTGASVTYAANQWHRLEINASTLAAGVTGINRIVAVISSLMATNGTLDVTAVLLTKAPTAGGHFDGSMVGNAGNGPYTYQWLGERGKSPSVRYERQQKSLTFDDLDTLWAGMTFDEVDAWMSKFSNLDGLEGTL